MHCIDVDGIGKSRATEPSDARCYSDSMHNAQASDLGDTRMTKIIQGQIEALDTTQELRRQLMAVLTDNDLAFKPTE
jgi:hypothetical protein